MDFNHRDFVCGWFGGCSGILVGHPFDTVKSRLQTQGIAGTAVRYKGTFHCFTDIYKTEGVRGLYKGMASPLLAMAAVNALVFSVHGSCSRLLDNTTNIPKLFNSALAGAAAGTVQTLICCPTELIKLRMQVQGIGQDVVTPTRSIFSSSRFLSSSKSTTSPSPFPSSSSSSYHGPWETTKRIYRQEGYFRGLNRGFVITLFREAPGFAAYFSSYDIFCAQVANLSGTTIDQLGVGALCLAGGCSGVVAWVVSYPFDVVKSRIQIDGITGTREYASVINCFIKSYRNEGFFVFAKGLNSTLLRAFPVNAATFCTFTLMMRYWKKWSPEN